jgi:hypothetical protein
MTAFWREKEMSIFFVSMAHHFPEPASQGMSRGSEAALISLERHATLTQPLRQNTLNRLRISPALTCVNALFDDTSHEHLENG